MKHACLPREVVRISRRSAARCSCCAHCMAPSEWSSCPSSSLGTCSSYSRMSTQSAPSQSPSHGKIPFTLCNIRGKHFLWHIIHSKRWIHSRRVQPSDPVIQQELAEAVGTFPHAITFCMGTGVLTSRADYDRHSLCFLTALMPLSDVGKGTPHLRPSPSYTLPNF